ncbi:MAG: prolipoprotein diacylglyceryl transferase, partial [Cruoricaptor ignavus]|nr:prolipoprotein diacylglyceryl transferase [Cruoricaptor ignavus]
MKPIFFRICLLIFAFFAQTFFAQSYSDGLSDGQLDINGKNIPVKIFATTSPQEFANFGDLPQKESVLVFLNEYVNSYIGTPFFQGFTANGYEFLDKNFQPISVQSHLSSDDFQYL